MDYKTALIRKQKVKPISITSASQYISSYDKMMDICDCSFKTLYVDIEDYLPILKDKIPLKSLQKYLENIAALNKFLRPEITDKQVDHFMKIKKEFDDEINVSNELSETQKEFIDVKWDDVLKIFNELKYGSLEQLILGMYCLIPPQRSMEYSQMWLRGPDTCPDDATGYINLNAKKPYMVLKRHKTVKEKGEFRIDLSQSKELCKLIYNSMINDERDYLFLNNFVKFNNTQLFNAWLIRHLKSILSNKAITTRSLRIISSNNDKTLVDQIKKAKDLNHSLLTHFKHYMKNIN